MITLRAEDFTKEDFQKLRELFHVSDTTQEFTFSTPVVTQNKTEYEDTIDIWNLSQTKRRTIISAWKIAKQNWISNVKYWNGYPEQPVVQYLIEEIE